MATVNLTSGSAARPVAANKKFVLEKTLDFNEVNRSAADVLQLFDIKAGWRVERAVVEVETAEGGVLTLDIGDGADANGFVGSADANVVGYSETSLTIASSVPAAYSGGKLYTVDDTLDMVLSANADTAKVHVRAEVTDFSTNT